MTKAHNISKTQTKNKMKTENIKNNSKLKI